MDRNEVVKQYGAYVRSLAAQVRRQFRMNLDMDDLVAFGNIGLLEASERYDPKFGNNFLTFAHYRIKGAIYDGLRKMGVLRGSDSQQASYGGGSNALMANVSDRGAASPSGGFEDAVAEAAENIPDPGESAEDRMEKEELKSKIQAAMQLLPEKERQLVEAYYFHGKTLEEAGLVLGQSKSWSSRLHAKAVARLQEILSEEVSGVLKPPPLQKGKTHGRPHAQHPPNRPAGNPAEGRPGRGRTEEDTAVEVRPGAGDDEVTSLDPDPRGERDSKS
jgi:RNA polymerase sigma factor for flagellar operon FliA